MSAPKSTSEGGMAKLKRAAQIFLLAIVLSDSVLLAGHVFHLSVFIYAWWAGCINGALGIYIFRALRFGGGAQ